MYGLLCASVLARMAGVKPAYATLTAWCLIGRPHANQNRHPIVKELCALIKHILYYITFGRNCKQISSIVDSNHKLLRSEHSPSASWGNGGLWCIWRDSNSHAFRHSHLKAACIPIPPQMHRRDPTVCKVGSLLAQLTGLEPAISWFVAMSSHPIELQLHSFAEL